MAFPCKKILSVILTGVLMLGLFSACGSTTTSVASDAADASSVQSLSVSETPATEPSVTEETSSAELITPMADASPEPIDLPIVDEQMIVTQWTGLHPLAAQFISSSDDMYLYQQLEALTGIRIEATLVGANAEEESFNLMVASNDYTDIICGMNYYSSGINGAMEDEVIIDLYDYVREYAPTYFSLISSDKDIYTTVVNTEGKMGTMVKLYKEKGLEDNGLIIRGDWLEGFGLTTIETYEDLHSYAQQAMDVYGVPMVIPSDGQLTQLSQGFGVLAGNYSVYDDVVKSYVETDGYYAYLSLLRDWYQEGIIDQDFISRAGTSDLGNMFISGEASIGTAYASAMVGLNGVSDDPNALYIGIGNPKQNASDEYTIAEHTSTVQDDDIFALSTSCDEDKIPALMTLVEYLMCEEGQLFYNYGTEDYTFSYTADGTPQFTDLVTANSDGYNFTVAEVMYATVYLPGILDLRRDFYNLTDVGFDALELFASQNTGLNCIPSNITSYLTTDESAEYAATSSDVETYIGSEILSFITGDKELTEESYQTFVDNCLSMGLDKMDAIYQSAYDRYLEAVSAIS